MVDAMNLLKPDAMTGHWEFTLGEARVKEIVDKLPFAFLAQNIRDSEFEDKVFEGSKIFERGGVKIAVIGQALPFTPIANPRWMFPEVDVRHPREGAARGSRRRQGEGRRSRRAAVPQRLRSRSQARATGGRHRRRADRPHARCRAASDEGRQHADGCLGLRTANSCRASISMCRARQIKGFRYRLIPVFADAIKPDAEMAALITKHRAPYEKDLARVLGKTDSLLYRRGNFDGTLDNVICDAILTERDAEIALSPGIRWGTSVLPGEDITFEDITNGTAMSYPGLLPHEDDGRAAERNPRGRRRQHLPSRSLLPAGRRHGAHRRARLHHRHRQDRSAAASPTCG